MNAAVKSAAVFCLVAIGVFFVSLSIAIRALDRKAIETLTTVQATAAETKTAIAQLDPTLATVRRSIAQLDPTLTDLRRTIEIAGGTLNLARDTLRNEQTSIRAANEQTIATMQNINVTLHSASQAIDSLPPLIHQAQQDLTTLDPVIRKVGPLVDNSASTMAKIDGIAGDLKKVADAATAPKHWYQRVYGGAKTGLELLILWAR